MPYEVTLGEPPTPTIAHVRSILDLTNYPLYLLYVLDSPSFFVSVEFFSGMFRSYSPLLRKSKPPVRVKDTIITT
uniref:Putative pvs-tRNA-like protein n=2 Tax=Pinus subgen. Strobus TaxID=139272 RepID=A0A0S2IAM5_PINSI|nr:putative pvs-tRNA-like protein [Pinus sibirica]ALO20530.1 putative pvs-tRNA-like protein [Pinus sibirica]QFS20738.1 putative pvs-tRNA-like protein [Pinus cembra]